MVRLPGIEPGSEAWEAPVLTARLQSRTTPIAVILFNWRGWAVLNAFPGASVAGARFRLNTASLYSDQRTRGLVVMTSPLQGEGRRFNPGRVHQDSIMPHPGYCDLRISAVFPGSGRVLHRIPAFCGEYIEDRMRNLRHTWPPYIPGAIERCFARCAGSPACRDSHSRHAGNRRQEVIGSIQTTSAGRVPAYW